MPNPKWIPGWRENSFDVPDDFAVLWNNSLLDVDEYGSDGSGWYFKTKMPGGGTIEVHLLKEDYFSKR